MTYLFFNYYVLYMFLFNKILLMIMKLLKIFFNINILKNIIIYSVIGFNLYINIY